MLLRTGRNFSCNLRSTLIVAKCKDDKADKLKVNVLLHCTGPEAIEEYSHFVFTNEGDKDAIKMSVANSRNCARVLIYERPGV